MKNSSLILMKMLHAAETGNLEWFRNYKFSQSKTVLEQPMQCTVALESVIINGHVELLQYLIDECFQDTEIPAISTLAVYWSVLHGHLEIIKYLISESTKYCSYFNIDRYISELSALVHETGFAELLRLMQSLDFYQLQARFPLRHGM